MTFSHALLVALYTTSVLAALKETTWGSVVFTYHGEKTPSLASGAHHFTPRGAIQAQNAGQIIRERYIEMRNTTNSPPHFYPINGISLKEIVNSQLRIMTLDDEIMAGSALAFTQGLYPPSNNSNTISEENIWTPGYREIGSLDFYPLGGYQYPSIKTLNTASDFDSIWLAGHTSCDKYSVSQVEYQNTSSYTGRVQSTFKFYQGLRKTIFENVQTTAGQVDFRKAEELYEYALYEHLHNFTMAKYSKFTKEELGQLSALASEQQFALNSGNISSIAGQTLAGKVITQMNQLMLNSGRTDKLSLMFTSFEPFISFFALSGLSSGPSASKFRSLPNHGSIMAFELFSYSDSASKTNVAKSFPSQADLYVRFLFRNGTEDTLTAYPLFGNSPSNTELRWYDFVKALDMFAVRDVDEWCNACATENVFCRQLLNAPAVIGQSGTQSHGLSPLISGVIGALVALALAALAFVALAFLGFRLQRRDQNSKASKSDLGVLRTSSGNGGYKGAEKLASDTDLRLKSGAGATVVRHERIGSWELKDGPQSPPPVYPSLDKDLESGRVRSYVDYNRRSQEYEDLERVNPFGDPVKPADQI